MNAPLLPFNAIAIIGYMRGWSVTKANGVAVETQVNLIGPFNILRLAAAYMASLPPLDDAAGGPRTGGAIRMDGGPPRLKFLAH